MDAEKGEVINIEIVSDVVCPWCFIGKRRLEKALPLVNRSYEASITWKPFELNPALPKEGVDRKEYMKRKFGDLDEVQYIENHIQQAAESVGLHFEFGRMERVPNTMNAHRLIWFSRPAGLQNEIVEALFKAVFLEGQFIGDLKVLTEIAASTGLDHSRVKDFLESNEGVDEVRDEIREGLKRGVQAVPNFLINNHYVINGAQPPDVMAQFLLQALKD